LVLDGVAPVVGNVSVVEAQRLYRIGFRDLLPFPIISMYLPQNPQVIIGLRHARDTGAAAG
jgi:hypothetical protein